MIVTSLGDFMTSLGDCMTSLGDCMTSLGDCSELVSRSFKVSGPTIWNDLPARLKDSSLSKNSFRKLLKTFLFDR